MKRNSNGTKDKIIELFYIEHKKPTEIAKKLNVANSYVTKIIQKDERYFKEKKYRAEQSAEKQQFKLNKQILFSHLIGGYFFILIRVL